MLVAIIFFCLAAVAALVLEGCGGGSVPVKCLNSEIDFVSQSFKATVTGSATVTFNETTHLALKTLDIVESTDLEKWNFLSEMHIPSIKLNLTIPFWRNFSEDVQIELKALLMAPQKKVVVWHRMTNNTDGNVISENCSVKMSEWFPTPEWLTSAFELTRKELQQISKCNGNDGIYDTFLISQVQFHGKIPHIPFVPLPNGSAFAYSVVDVEMDKNYLLHSALASVDVEMDLQGHETASTKESTNMKVSHTRLGGPTAEDLDYTKQWGECNQLTYDFNDFDIDTLFQPASGSEAALVLTEVMHQGFFQSHILNTLKSIQKANILKSRVII